MKNSRNPTPDNKDALAGSELCQSLSPENAGQRLNEDPLLKRDLLGQYKCAPLHIDLGDTDIFRKTSRIKVSRPQGITNRVITIQAVVTGIAGDMVGNKDPISDLILIHPFSNFNTLSCNLMAKHPGRFLNPIPFHDIAATDTAGQNLNQQFTRADGWN